MTTLVLYMAQHKSPGGLEQTDSWLLYVKAEYIHKVPMLLLYRKASTAGSDISGIELRVFVVPCRRSHSVECLG